MENVIYEEKGFSLVNLLQFIFINIMLRKLCWKTNLKLQTSVSRILSPKIHENIFQSHGFHGFHGFLKINPNSVLQPFTFDDSKNCYTLVKCVSFLKVNNGKLLSFQNPFATFNNGSQSRKLIYQNKKKNNSQVANSNQKQF